MCSQFLLHVRVSLPLSFLLTHTCTHTPQIGLGMFFSFGFKTRHENPSFELLGGRVVLTMSEETT